MRLTLDSLVQENTREVSEHHRSRGRSLSPQQAAPIVITDEAFLVYDGALYRQYQSWLSQDNWLFRYSLTSAFFPPTSPTSNPRTATSPPCDGASAPRTSRRQRCACAPPREAAGPASHRRCRRLVRRCRTRRSRGGASPSPRGGISRRSGRRCGTGQASGTYCFFCRVHLHGVCVWLVVVRFQRF